MSRLTLFLTSKKGFHLLEGIIRSFGSEVIDFVVVGRENNIIENYSEKIYNLAFHTNINIYENSDSYNIFTKYIIAISWRWLISEKEGSILIRLYDSLLSEYREFAPFLNHLINQGPYIKVAAIVSNAKYEKGEIIAQAKTRIDYPLRIKEAISKVALLYQDVLQNVIQQVVENISLETISQNGKEAT